MIISSSAVSMSSERSYQKVESSVSMSVTSKAEDAIKLDISDKSRGLLRQLNEGAAEKEKARREEEISELGAGSGYLALDKNEDGTINDGSELFGTKSGDGFADMAAYDGDGNGWIDEADDVFSKLKIWTKDENGENLLLNLKEADVGAIYLGNAATQFSLNNTETNETNAMIRKTGVFLKESGAVGTVQHVDLVL